MRNIIISAAMSICLPYLPIWEWDGIGDMIAAAAVFFWIILALLTATEGDKNEKETRFHKA
ncbi:MAG TPA: hypothetical protein IAA05_04195 [Candidatus Blautia excrementipullorum]|nr:hypothetical protein [Candidatus Blautia excrementipullorum]